MLVRKLATAGLASQGRATLMAESMTDAECEMIAATMTENGLATTETADACRRAVREYRERMKATGDGLED